MAKEPLQEKELQIKKTARRRLVGAIAMVVILLIVLPFLLKDQASDSAQDPVKVTIINEGPNSEPIPELDDAGQGFESNINPTEVTGFTQPTLLPSQHDESAKAPNTQSNTPLPEVTPSSITQLALQSDAPEAQINNKDKEIALKKQEQGKIAAEAKQNANLEKQQAEKLAQEKIKDDKIKEEQAKLEKAKQEKALQEKFLEEEKIKQAKAKEDKSNEENARLEKSKQEKADATTKPAAAKFYVQYGVFSDPKNLEKLQSDLKEKGFAVETDNIDAKGKKIRLRSKIYPSKDEALKALKSVQVAGFTAIVTAK